MRSHIHFDQLSTRKALNKLLSTSFNCLLLTLKTMSDYSFEYLHIEYPKAMSPGWPKHARVFPKLQQCSQCLLL